MIQLNKSLHKSLFFRRRDRTHTHIPLSLFFISFFSRDLLHFVSISDASSVFLSTQKQTLSYILQRHKEKKNLVPFTPGMREKLFPDIFSCPGKRELDTEAASVLGLNCELFFFRGSSIRTHTSKTDIHDCCTCASIVKEKRKNERNS